MLAAWLVAAVLVAAAAVAAVATRVPSLERPVRLAVTPLVVLVAVFVVADLGLVLRGGEADRPDSWITHLGYAVAAVGLVPALVQRRPEPAPDDAPATEAEPASLWVVAVALLAVAVCVVRLVQTR